jgi:hypothetical protein
VTPGILKSQIGYWYGYPWATYISSGGWPEKNEGCPPKLKSITIINHDVEQCTYQYTPSYLGGSQKFMNFHGWILFALAVGNDGS